MSAGIVLIGAGQAALETAIALRRGGYLAPVTLLGDEPHLPYQRPPLSKACLESPEQRSSVQLRAEAYYSGHDIQVRTSDPAIAIDRAAKQVHTKAGHRYAYDKLVLATGSSSRRMSIPGSELDGVLSLRSLDDAHTLAARLRGANRLVIIGAGFIGLEVASVSASLGIHTCIVEASSRAMSRICSEETSKYFEALHSEHGVDLRRNDSVQQIIGDSGRVGAVVLGSGTRLQADLVLVAIGGVPNDELASASDLPTNAGVLVNKYLQPLDPDIYAIGDCVRFLSPDGSPIRLESVQNAVDQGRYVAAHATGKSTQPYQAVPWFWSVQAGTRLQIAGLTTNYNCAVKCVSDQRSFSVLCYRDDRLLGVESVNRASDHMAARRILAGGPAPDLKTAAAPGFDLTKWVSASAIQRPGQR